MACDGCKNGTGCDGDKHDHDEPVVTQIRSGADPLFFEAQVHTALETVFITELNNLGNPPSPANARAVALAEHEVSAEGAELYDRYRAGRYMLELGVVALEGFLADGAMSSEEAAIFVGFLDRDAAIAWANMRSIAAENIDGCDGSRADCLEAFGGARSVILRLYELAVDSGVDVGAEYYDGVAIANEDGTSDTAVFDITLVPDPDRGKAKEPMTFGEIFRALTPALSEADRRRREREQREQEDRGRSNTPPSSSPPAPPSSPPVSEPVAAVAVIPPGFITDQSIEIMSGVKMLGKRQPRVFGERVFRSARVTLAEWQAIERAYIDITQDGHPPERVGRGPVSKITARMVSRMGSEMRKNIGGAKAGATKTRFPDELAEVYWYCRARYERFMSALEKLWIDSRDFPGFIPAPSDRELQLAAGAINNDSQVCEGTRRKIIGKDDKISGRPGCTWTRTTERNMYRNFRSDFAGIAVNAASIPALRQVVHAALLEIQIGSIKAATHELVPPPPGFHYVLATVPGLFPARVFAMSGAPRVDSVSGTLTLARELAGRKSLPGRLLGVFGAQNLDKLQGGGGDDPVTDSVVYHNASRAVIKSGGGDLSETDQILAREMAVLAMSGQEAKDLCVAGDEQACELVRRITLEKMPAMLKRVAKEADNPSAVFAAAAVMAGKGLGDEDEEKSITDYLMRFTEIINPFSEYNQDRLGAAISGISGDAADVAQTAMITSLLLIIVVGGGALLAINAVTPLAQTTFGGVMDFNIKALEAAPELVAQFTTKPIEAILD